MPVIYKISIIKKLCQVLLAVSILLLTGCSLITEVKEQQLEEADIEQPVKTVTTKKITAKPAEAIEAQCACKNLSIKEVVKFIDKPCEKIDKKHTKLNDFSTRPNNLDISDRLIVGRVENVILSDKGLALKARIDTGANTSSLNALDLVEFERDGKRWVRYAVLDPSNDEKIYFERKISRFVRIKQMEKGFQRRPVVKMGVQLGRIDEKIELTLTDRSDYIYQVLVGRNFLLDRMLVDVSQKYIALKQGF